VREPASSFLLCIVSMAHRASTTDAQWAARRGIRRAVVVEERTGTEWGSAMCLDHDAIGVWPVLCVDEMRRGDEDVLVGRTPLSLSLSPKHAAG
jgi:hypothetical protein